MSSSNIASLTLGNLEIWQSSQNVMSPMSARGFETIMDKTNETIDFYSLPGKSPKNKSQKFRKKKNKELQNSLEINTKLTKKSFKKNNHVLYDNEFEWSKTYLLYGNKTYHGRPDRPSLEYNMSTTVLNEYNGLIREYL